MATKDSTEGTETNEVIAPEVAEVAEVPTAGSVTLGYSEASRIENTAAAQEAEREAYEKNKGQATEGVTVLGYSEASRIENTAAAQEAEQAAYEKSQAKAAKKET